ncbi:hypothetical protein LC048_02245 [Mesobacillus subterraneus]|nr:hypothetical protein [Mesobacillus subterraneus]WLR55849.1 hypothetical protein LC048_02245 [Mesobacillus subterraneus]
MTSLAGTKRLEKLGAAARQATRGARRWSWKILELIIYTFLYNNNNRKGS